MNIRIYFYNLLLLPFLISASSSQWVQISSNTYTSFYAVKFFNQNTGIIAGQDTVGKIFRTVNGGTNWSLVHRTDFNERFECLFFINNQTGWSGTYYRYIYKTTNGGINWFVSGTPLPALGRIKSLFFIDSQTGWLLSEIGHAKTTNGGTSWNIYSGGISGKTIHFFDVNTGVAGTSDWKIKRTTNGGSTFSPVYSLPSYYNISDFHFISSQTGFASGTNKIVLKTTNSGANWNFISIDSAHAWTENFSKINFIDENFGYGAGQYIFSDIHGTTMYGILRKTTNGGINWTSISVNYTPDNYEDIDIAEGQFGYLVGHQDYMYKSITAGYVNITAINSNIPAQFSIHQNYPNPFNPNTTIKFDIPRPEYIKLTIFDVLGNEIKTLVNENLNAGEYSIDFNAANMVSGIYFYRLSAHGFSQTKKMILIK